MLRGSAAPARRGSASTIAIAVLPVLLLVLAGVVRVGLLRDDKTELQTAADAAALAAARTLADGDDLLADDPDQLQEAVGRARQAAVAVAAANSVNGTPVALDADSGVTAGHLDPDAGTFRPFGPGSGGDVNAVRVTVTRGEITVRATAVLDFAVTGLRPATDQPVPLAPIGLSARDMERSTGGDVTVHLARGARNGVVQGVPLLVGPPEPGKVPRQLGRGVEPGDLPADLAGGRGGPPGLFAAPFPEEAGRGAVNEVAAALAALRDEGAARVWPLVEATPGNPARVTITGYVAARVVAAGVDGRSGAVRMTLRPAVLVTPAAVTTPGAGDRAGPFARTVCRLRLAE